MAFFPSGISPSREAAGRGLRKEDPDGDPPAFHDKIFSNRSKTSRPAKEFLPRAEISPKNFLFL
nr:hypothetical protein [Bacillaceae bacterium]